MRNLWGSLCSAYTTRLRCTTGSWVCALKSCIGVAPRVSQSTGRIKSGLEDDYLPANTCLWQIDLPVDDGGRQLQKIALRFSEFDLERSTAAVHSTDAMEVYQVPNTEKALPSQLDEYRLLRKFSGNEFGIFRAKLGLTPLARR